MSARLVLTMTLRNNHSHYGGHFGMPTAGFSAHSWGLDGSVAEVLSTVEFSRTPGLYPVDARSIPHPLKL